MAYETEEIQARTSWQRIWLGCGVPRSFTT